MHRKRKTVGFLEWGYSISLSLVVSSYLRLLCCSCSFVRPWKEVHFLLVNWGEGGEWHKVLNETHHRNKKVKCCGWTCNLEAWIDDISIGGNRWQPTYQGSYESLPCLKLWVFEKWQCLCLAPHFFILNQLCSLCFPRICRVKMTQTGSFLLGKTYEKALNTFHNTEEINGVRSWMHQWVYH